MIRKSLVRLVTAILIIACVVSFFELASAQEPTQMTLEGGLEVGSSVASACIFCVPPSSSGSIKLVVNFETGSVSGNVSGEGAGQGSGICCDENGQPVSGEAMAQATTSFSGSISGSVDPQSGAITAQATLQGTWSGSWVKCECDTCTVLAPSSFTREATITGVVTRDGSASGQISWASPPCSTGGSWTAQATAITYDRDGDGLPDEEDACPDEYAETEDGCPPDRDGDGLPDEEDACPDEYAETEDGCPADRDGDGLPDGEDACPDEYAETEDGCPADRDGDGLPDDEDACPDEYAETEDGCPADRDGDGLPDGEDACPDKYAETEDGCPQEAVAPIGPATEGEEPTSPPTVSDLVRDLEEFLAGKGVNGPTPGQAAATGVATATLLMTWLMNQLLSGANGEDLLKAIQQWWRGGDIAPQQKPVEKIGEGDRVPRKVPEAEEITPVKKTPPHIPERGPASETPPRIPVEEDLESKARRLGRDARDYLQAFDDTLNDAKKLKDKIGGKVPDELKTDTQKKVERTVDNVLDKVRKTTKLDEAKQFVDRANTYMKDWERVDQKLKDRPVSKEAKDAVKMLETATRAATEIPMQVSDRAHDTLAEVVEKVLGPFSPEAAGRAKKGIEEQKEALHKVREGVVHLPTSAVRTTTSKRFGEYWEAAEKNNPELRGIKGPGAFKPVKRDFETGSEKAARWYEEFRQWLDKHGPWQLRRVKPLDPD